MPRDFFADEDGSEPESVASTQPLDWDSDEDVQQEIKLVEHDLKENLKLLKKLKERRDKKKIQARPPKLAPKNLTKDLLLQILKETREKRDRETQTDGKQSTSAERKTGTEKTD